MLPTAVRPSPAAAALLASVAMGCGSDGPSAPNAACAASPTVLALDPLRASVVRPADAGACVRLGGANARYLIVPQFAAQGEGDDRATFSLTASTPVPPAVVASRAVDGRLAESATRGNAVQAGFDRLLRARERALPVDPDATRSAGGRARRSVTASAAAPAARAALDSVRDFNVLASLDGDRFVTARAALRYAGENVAVYVDQAVPAPGFTPDELRAFGDLFDQTLYGIDVAAFGEPSDVDANGVVLVVVTPRVNALTPAARCSADGFVAGYFYGVDLVPSARGSNKGELFYALAPDPAGSVGCAHSVADVTTLSPPVFLHEFQHMISYNQHRIRRRGADEAVWLNEGLSHIAEELGSLYYESRNPPPAGRANPAQLFPDASQPYIVPNLVNAFNYLAESRNHSVTSFVEFGTLEERGAAWLFLRWLGDQKGSGIYRRLVETELTGTTNVAAAAGEPFAGLFADFGTAVWTDSLPGLPREAVPARYRFVSRNLRALFARLNSTGNVQSAFPVRLTSLAGEVSRDMRWGTMDFFDVRVPAESASVRVRFAPGSTDRGFATAAAAQYAVFRLPD